MILLHLERIASTAVGTFGRIELPSGLAIFTCECPWKENRKRVSCIPDGDYPLVRGRYYRGKYDTWIIPDGSVPDRTLIKIHRANKPSQLAGCIAPGMELDIRDQEYRGVLRSREALELLMTELGEAPEVTLRISTHHDSQGFGTGTRPLLA